MPQGPLLNHLRPAECVTLAGWIVPAHFGDPVAEVAAAHAGVGLIDRSERGRLELRGEDRGRWLNNIVTNDTVNLPVGSGCRALLLTVKGRIGCDLRVWSLADRFLIDTAFDTADGLLANLERLRLYGDRVELRAVRDETVQIGVHGPAAAGALEVTIDRWRCTEADGRVIVRHDELGVPGYDVIVPAADGPALWDRLAAGACPFGWRAAEILRVEAGEPRWAAELTEEHFPGEAELDEALSHTKGCYPGQEIVARMRDRGHPNWLLRPIAIAGARLPVRGAHLLAAGETKPVGTLTSVVGSPTMGLRALGYVRRERAEPGTELHVTLPDAPPVRATVLRPRT